MESESEKNSVCKGENEHDEGAGEEENNSTCEKSSISMSGSRASISTDSTDSICSSIGTYIANKPHKANDTNWQAISLVITRESSLGLQHFRIIKRLGAGDIGTVYLAQLKGTSCLYAIKVMDRDSLKSRKKLIRAHTEREILAILDHPFLPTLYTFFETEKFLCLVMEYCSGGDLHNLRQRQPKRHFSESTAKFYASEVLVAMEYLHMMGIIYRDLKPENVLVSEDGHIMLSDFDLSLRSFVSPSLVSSKNKHKSGNNGYYAQPACIEPQCITPTCVVTSCFFPRILSNKSMAKWKSKSKIKIPSGMPFKLPEFLAEPSNARSMSFVGTHEYLAPEIVKGEGHGSAVDWWTFGIFLYEMLLGKTPFKGENNHATLLNVVGQPLKFPDSPTISFAAKDLIRGLLVKEPQQRLAYAKGATEIKQHPFFEGVNWALIRSTIPPKTPKVSKTNLIRKTTAKTTVAPATNEPSAKDTNSDSLYLDFTTMF